MPTEKVGVLTLNILQKIKWPNSCTVTIERKARIEPASGTILPKRVRANVFSNIKKSLSYGVILVFFWAFLTHRCLKKISI